ncbi:hypothetical protein MMC28_009051 [Mycoblastus sanguinarius]|nr:hypothetical protein [Mycoblastus sanguinarius]
MTVVKPIRLAHVVLKTQREQYKAMVNYYKIFLSATASYEDEMLSFLTYDEEHHRIAIACIPSVTGPRVPSASGLLHVAFTFATLHDLALAYQQRKSHGIEPFWCVNHGPTTSMYYRDPDGNEIETQVDNYESNEEATEFMRSQQFADNVIGTDFDPEELVRRIESGEDEGLIKKRLEIGKRSDVPV